MRALICFILFLGITSSTQSTVMPRQADRFTPLPSRVPTPEGVRKMKEAIQEMLKSVCRSGEAGSVIICGFVTEYDGNDCKTINATEATKCLSRDALKWKFHNTDVKWGFINPAQGGHCLFYSTEDCADKTGMDLKNSDKLKITCGGINGDMIPDEWQGLKCYGHPAD